jgi:hypothetical protein
MRSKIIHRAAISVVLSLISAGPIAAPSEAYTLFAGVTHSESVPPANTRYPIAKVSKEIPATEKKKETVPSASPHYPIPKLSKETPATERQKEVPVAVQPSGTLETPVIEWHQIPKWMAGTWNKKGDQTTSYTDFRTGLTTPTNEWTEDDMNVTWGHQFDRQGNIWQAFFLPWERDAISGGKAVKFVIVSLKAEMISSDQLVSRVHSIVSESVGSQVVDVYQQESLNDFVLLPSGQLENHSSDRNFTYEGRPIREGALVSLFTKIRPFEPVATHNGVDLLKSLNEYLIAHNMSQLVRTSQ